MQGSVLSVLLAQRLRMRGPYPYVPLRTCFCVCGTVDSELVLAPGPHHLTLSAVFACAPLPPPRAATFQQLVTPLVSLAAIIRDNPWFPRVNVSFQPAAKCVVVGVFGLRSFVGAH